MTKRLFILAQALLAASLSVSARAADPPPGGGVDLCGITAPVDQLLHCSAQGGRTAAGDGSGGDQSSGAAATTSTEPSVRTVSPIPRYVANLLLLRFEPGTSAQRQQQVLADAGVVVVRRIPQIGAVVVQMPPERRDDALARLEASPWVVRAAKDAVVEALDTTPNDPDWSDQWGLRKIGLPSAWDRTHGSTSVIVAVLDTGIDATHRDLSGAVLPGFDLVNGDADPSDDHGHGTAVAGLIAARTNNREGVAGVCWSCSILPVKVLDADGIGNMSLIAAGIVRAVAAGAHVINLSLGGPGDDQTLDDAVAYANSNGAIVVAAAGNNGADVPFYPAATPGVLSVAATDAADHLYSWSNFGSWATIAAPGCNLATIRGGGYGTFCGTSSAAPITSGLVGLALSAQPGATREEVLTALQQATTPIGSGVARGRIDAAATLDALPPAGLPPPPPAETATLRLKSSLKSKGSPRTYSRSVASGTLAATLTFTGTETLTLAIHDSSGALLAKETGSSPIRVSLSVQAGAVWLEISGARVKTRFTLTVSYPRAVATPAETSTTGQPGSPTVLLSAISEDQPGTKPSGPQLGAPPPGTTAPDITALGFSIRDQQSEPLVAAINRIRRAHGLGRLAASPALSRAALAHVRALAAAGQFTHGWDDGTPFSTWIVRYYPPRRSSSWLAGENLLWAPGAIASGSAAAAWLASPSHRRILLTPTWRDVGVGIVTVTEAPGAYGERDVVIVAADFGARSPTPTSRLRP